MKKINFLLSVCLFVCVISANAQTPIIRKIEPIRQTAIINNPTITRQANKDTLPKLTRTPYRPIKTVLESFSSLHFAYDLGSIDHQNFGWDFTKNATIEVTQNFKKNNWTKPFAWRRIPAEAAYGRWEISLLPFPINNFARDFTGIIRSGIVETNGVDSIYFDIKYIDDANMPKRETTQNNNDKIQPLQQINIRNNPSSQPTAQGNVAVLTPINTIPTTADNTKNDEIILTEVDNTALSKMQLFDNGTRKYYIRVVPLDASKNELSKISNSVTLQEKKGKEFKGTPTVYEESPSKDYTITNINYVKLNYGDPAFVSCAVVTGYNNTDNQFAKAFMTAYPIGSVICPQPPKDKSWYEKAFDGVTGFTKKAIDGVANFYNETKGYLKNKFKEYNCNANLTVNIINPVTKIQEVAGPEVCETICGAAFDYGMAAVGLPPSLPTTDVLTKMAEGQIVDLACDEMESQTGIPIPDEAREEIRKSVHNKIEESLKKGVVSAGFLNVKPDPRGLFQTAYLEIEVTRTAKTTAKRGIINFGIGENTTRTMETFGYGAKDKKMVEIHGRLFEEDYVKVPFIENVGDKKKVYLILKPQESYTYIDKDKGFVTSIGYGPQPGTWNNWSPNPNDYQSITTTPGFKALSYKSTTTFNLGLKTLPGLQLIYDNQ